MTIFVAVFGFLAGAAKGSKRLPLGLRWPIERTNSWLSNFGHLRRNTDRLIAHRLAQFALAVALIIMVKLVKWAKRWESMPVASCQYLREA